MITLQIEPGIQGDRRNDLREIVVNSHPHAILSEKSDIDSDSWEVGPGQNPDEFKDELDTLAMCLRAGCFKIMETWDKKTWIITDLP